MWGRALGKCWVGQPVSPLCCPVWGEDLERGWCHCLASRGFLGICPISSHFSHSPYVTGALPAVALVLNPRVGGFAYIVTPCGPFKWSLLKIWQFFPLSQPPLVFIARSYEDLSSWLWNPGLCSLAWGWDRSLLIFIHHTWCGTTCPASVTSLGHTGSPRLTTHLHISFLPTHLDECGFFKSLVISLPSSSVFWEFWVLFVLRCSCSSPCGCTGKQSVSTSASILIGSQDFFSMKKALEMS